MTRAGSSIADRDAEREMRCECFKAMKRIQEAAGFSVAEWARRSKLSQPGLVAYTSGDVVPSRDALASLCAGLRLPDRALQDITYLNRVADMARKRSTILKTIGILRERIERAASALEGKVVADPGHEGRVLAELSRSLKPAAILLSTVLSDLAEPGLLDADFPEASALNSTRETLVQFRVDVRSLWIAIHKADRTTDLNDSERLARAFSAVFLSHGYELQRVLDQAPVRATTLLAALAFFLQLGKPPATQDTVTGGKVNEK